MSSPLQMAVAECSNFSRDGGCLGIPAKCLRSSEPTVAAPLDRCKLAQSDGICGYFAKVIAPLVHYFPRYAKAVAVYNRRLARQEAPPVATEGLGTCDCGRPMSKGRRMCDSCARKNRLAAKRRWKDKRSGRSR